ncbi:MAG: prepilin-type N-terminal cleavage/methylation domain-containing protein [bacterium]|nr:MAG: prepilin-type N-terminal cleavage/methylation domain-containing protein [bacterium]
MDKRGMTLIELMIVIVVIGIIAAAAIPNLISMQLRAKEATVKSNCHTVQLAAENFAVLNLGKYASDHDTDVTPDGDTILDMLPGGQPLENPFTKAKSEPITAVQAANAGEIAYSPLLNNGIPVGYTITGGGRNGIVVITVKGGR